MSETPHETPQADEDTAPAEGEFDPEKHVLRTEQVVTRHEAIKTPAPDLDVGQAEVQARMDEATRKGYIGGTPDPTPDENYSLLTPDDAPTPETDPELQRKAHEANSGNRLLAPGRATAQTSETYQES